MSPKLDSLSFGMVISNRIMEPLPYTKEFFLHKGGLGFILKEDLVVKYFWYFYMCSNYEANIF